VVRFESGLNPVWLSVPLSHVYDGTLAKLPQTTGFYAVPLSHVSLSHYSSKSPGSVSIGCVCRASMIGSV